ncbi:hypothetical protein L596_009547 [Steinernema carpocapsae]|uniref:Uncharacterized protein n=1 Tax=Steinernema carpocapsae TaxID=34508 RepID=A0A4U5PFV5_STECR|nr:hypothetical protein L596_009547 [Steinernema carpocapsae]
MGLPGFALRRRDSDAEAIQESALRSLREELGNRANPGRLDEWRPRPEERLSAASEECGVPKRGDYKLGEVHKSRDVQRNSEPSPDHRLQRQIQP